MVLLQFPINSSIQEHHNCSNNQYVRGDAPAVVRCDAPAVVCGSPVVVVYAYNTPKLEVVLLGSAILRVMLMQL